jgi:hypothetical protein
VKTGSLGKEEGRSGMLQFFTINRLHWLGRGFIPALRQPATNKGDALSIGREMMSGFDVGTNQGGMWKKNIE